MCIQTKMLALHKFFRSLFLSNIRALKLNSLSLLLLKPSMFATVKVIYKKICSHCHAEAKEIATISE